MKCVFLVGFQVWPVIASSKFRKPLNCLTGSLKPTKCLENIRRIWRRRKRKERVENKSWLTTFDSFHKRMLRVCLTRWKTCEMQNNPRFSQKRHEVMYAVVVATNEVNFTLGPNQISFHCTSRLNKGKKPGHMQMAYEELGPHTHWSAEGSRTPMASQKWRWRRTTAALQPTDSVDQ